jgi:saccharopine dehydrogenase (NADP+, L-glutamate forming)
LLDEAERNDLAGLTYAQFTAKLAGATDTSNLEADVAKRMGIAPDSFIISNMEWLGLLGDEPLPDGPKSPIDIMTATMLAKMQYAPGERDMLILQHEFIAEYPNKKEKITSTMIDFGIPHGDTSMNRTVGLPAAVGARMILEGKITTTGVLMPVTPEIYEPVLEELERLGIHFMEKTETLQERKPRARRKPKAVARKPKAAVRKPKTVSRKPKPAAKGKPKVTARKPKKTASKRPATGRKPK